MKTKVILTLALLFGASAFASEVGLMVKQDAHGRAITYFSPRTEGTTIALFAHGQGVGTRRNTSDREMKATTVTDQHGRTMLRYETEH